MQSVFRDMELQKHVPRFKKMCKAKQSNLGLQAWVIKL